MHWQERQETTRYLVERETIRSGEVPEMTSYAVEPEMTCKRR